MQAETQPGPVSTAALVFGWIITALAAFGLLASGAMKVMIALKQIETPAGGPDTGWSESAMLGLAIVEIGCTLLYLCPRLAVLGAILLTGYLGGAVATHVRIGDFFVPPIVFGFLLWLGLFLRDARLRTLIPWRSPPMTATGGGFGAMFAKVLLTLAVLVGVIVALIAAQPAEFRITRSTFIDAPPSEVFDQVNDFHKWDAWSPWKKLDPAAKNTFEGPSAGTGAIFKWSGNDQIGEGQMTLTESRPNELIKIKLEFFRPFPDSSNVEFHFKAKEKGTEVTWNMIGNKGMLSKTVCMFMDMDKMVGGSFAEGLANLKTVVEAPAKR